MYKDKVNLTQILTEGDFTEIITEEFEEKEIEIAEAIDQIEKKYQEYWYGNQLSYPAINKIYREINHIFFKVYKNEPRFAESISKIIFLKKIDNDRLIYNEYERIKDTHKDILKRLTSPEGIAKHREDLIKSLEDENLRLTNLEEIILNRLQSKKYKAYQPLFEENIRKRKSHNMTFIEIFKNKAVNSDKDIEEKIFSEWKESLTYDQIVGKCDIQDFWKIVCELFSENGMKGQGSLNAKTPLNKQKKTLQMFSQKVSRNNAILFSFGLGLSAKQASMLIKKITDNQGFNPHNPMDIIYYYLLFNGKQLSEAGNLEDWTTSGEKIFKSGEKKTWRTDKFWDDEKFWKDKAAVQYYIYELKNIQANTKKSYLTEAFFDDLKKGSDSERISSILESLNDDKEDMHNQYENLINEDEWLNVEILDLIFPDRERFTENTLYKRKEGLKEILREDMAIAHFLKYTLYLEEENKFYDEANDWRGEYLDSFNSIMEKCNFHTFYYRRFLDIFMYLCLFYPEPRAYFMANWYRVDRYRREKNNEDGRS